LDVRRKLLHEWKQRVEDGGDENLRSRFVCQESILAVVIPLGDVVRNALHNHTRLARHVDCGNTTTVACLSPIALSNWQSE